MVRGCSAESLSEVLLCLGETPHEAGEQDWNMGICSVLSSVQTKPSSDTWTNLCLLGCCSVVLTLGVCSIGWQGSTQLYTGLHSRCGTDAPLEAGNRTRASFWFIVEIPTQLLCADVWWLSCFLKIAQFPGHHVTHAACSSEALSRKGT